MFLDFITIEKDDSLSKSGQLFYGLTRKIYLLFLILHFGFALIFAATNLPVLAVTNIVSVFFYYAILWLSAKHYTRWAFALLTVEVIAHAGLCSILLGDAGFTEALLFLPIVFFLFPTHVRNKIMYFLFIMVFYIAFRYNDQFGTPVADINMSLLQTFALSTSILIIIIDCYIAYCAFKMIESQSATIAQNNTRKNIPENR